MKWRFLSDDGVSAAAGLAADEALMSTHARSAAPAFDATLRLYSYRAHCALVGRYQNLSAELDEASCSSLDVEVGRRPTGGGAILMGPAQLGVAVATRSTPELTPRAQLRVFSRGVVAGLAELGIEPRFRSKNDLEVDGRKIAGLGLHLDADGAVLFHASVLVDLDMELMLRVLNIPGAKVSDKAVRDIGDRVTTVSRELGRPRAASDVRPAFRRGFETAFEIDAVDGTLTGPEISRRDRLIEEKYAHPEWTHQRSPRRDARGSATLKTPEGLLRVYVGRHGDVMNSVLLCGDFNALPPGVARLEAALRWSRVDPERIHALAEQNLESTDLGVGPRDVAEAVIAAATHAREIESAHPVRREGACYAPTPDGRDEGSKR